MIEDDAYKASRISAFLQVVFPESTVAVERSVNAGLTRLVEKPSPDLLLLDMSLSTFDVGPRETGGRPQNFGGIGVLEQMLRLRVAVPVILITQFPYFPKDGRDISLADIRVDLAQRFPGLFRDLIYYNSRETEWERSLEKSIHSAVGKAGANENSGR